MDLEQVFTDRELQCPVCTDNSRITYKKIPEHTRQYVNEGEHHTDHMPAAKDYQCLNCDAMWTMHEQDH